MLTMVLLIIILLLLIAIVAMIVTGWPGRERAEIEKTGNALRREMAEHRAESIQLLHSIRIEVEDSVHDSIEREMASFATRSSRSRRNPGASRAVSKSRAQQVGIVAESDDLPVMVEEDGLDYGMPESVLEARQLPLFPDKQEPVRAVAPAVFAATAPSVPRVEEDNDVAPVEVIRIGYMIDDIPDVE
jgi:FtsZ-interacting cell division protein ZipA